jgi:hypothetical protein
MGRKVEVYRYFRAVPDENIFVFSQPNESLSRVCAKDTVFGDAANHKYPHDDHDRKRCVIGVLQRNTV